MASLLHFLISLLKFIHQSRFFFKLSILIFTLSYYCILQNSSRGSEYSSTKQYCVSNTQKCKTPNEDYHPAKVDSLSYDICYAGDLNHLCVDNEAIQCLYTKRNRHQSIRMEDEVVARQHEYFQYSVPIIIFTVLASLGTLLFQSKLLGVSFVQDETAFASRKITEFFVDKFITICVVISFSLIIVSSLQFDFMMTEECDVKTLSRQNFCDDLAGCDVNIRSIIYPEKWVATDYRNTSLILAICAIVFEIYTFIFPPISEDDPSEEYNHQIRQMNIQLSTSSHNDDNGGAMVYIVQTPRGSRVSRTYMTSTLSPRASQLLSPVRYVRQHQVFKSTNKSNFKKWKFNIPLSSMSDDAECAICLECFHNPAGSEKSKKRVNGTARAQDRSGLALVHPLDIEADDGEGDDDDETTSAQFESTLQSIVRVPCGHMFHEICIFEWTRENSTCPVCRADTTTGNDVNE